MRPIIIEEEIQILKQRMRFGKKIKDITVKHYIESLSAVLEDAKKNRFIPENPIRWISLPRVERGEQGIPTESEMGNIVAALNDEPPLYRCFYIMALYTGAR